MIAPGQAGLDSQHGVGVVLLHGVAEDVVPFGDPAQGVEVPHDEVGDQPPAGQVVQAAVRSNKEVVFFDGGHGAGVHGPGDDTEWLHGSIFRALRARTLHSSYYYNNCIFAASGGERE